MSGMRDNNHPAFYEAEAKLVFAHKGARIINPARNDIGSTSGMSREDVWLAYMRLSLTQIAEANHMHMLNGWMWSEGANLEYSIAKGLGLVITCE